MTDDALHRLSPRFESMYAKAGRPSIAPEHLLRALLLQVIRAVYRNPAAPRGHAAHRAQNEESLPRLTHDAARRLRHQSTRAQTPRKSFGWMKTAGGLRKHLHRGGALVNWQFGFAAADFNLVRMRTLPALITR